MRVAWEAAALLPPRTGVGRYAFELAKALLAHGEVELHLVWQSVRRELPPEDLAQIDRAILHTGRILPGPLLMKMWNRLGFPAIETFAGRADLVHGPAAMLPPSRTRARVLTIHDLHFMRHPEHAHRQGGGFLARHLPKAASKATRIIVPTEETAKDVVALLGVDRVKIDVIPYGGAEEFLAEPSDAQWAEFEHRFERIPERFWLTIATIEPRKNLSTLLDAQEQLAARIADAPTLVLVGPTGWERREVVDRIAEMKALGLVTMPGYIDPLIIGCLCRRAEAMILPSFAEGFGMPILEALASGCPVLCSDIPVFHEVTGGNARFFDPHRAESVAEAMRDALNRRDEMFQLASKGRNHVAPLTWARAAERTVDVYRAALG